MLDELLAAHAPDWRPPRLEREAIMHGHCHHAAIGYEAGDAYRVSMRAGERVLLPAVRSAADDALIVADGFSCRTQIHEATGRRAHHTAEVLELALYGADARS